jgi:hypothetical protein
MSLEENRYAVRQTQVELGSTGRSCVEVKFYELHKTVVTFKLGGRRCDTGTE